MGDIILKFRLNKTDPEMVEIFEVIQRSVKSKHVLWAVAHYDLLLPDKQAMKHLERGEIVTFKLVRVDE